MQKLRVTILFASNEPDWVSCKSISKNLTTSYKLLEKDPRFHLTWIPVNNDDLPYDASQTIGHYLEIARQVDESKPSVVVFLDHHLNPLPLVLALKAQNPGLLRKCKVVAHVYGDFTWYAARWHELGKELSGSYVKLICASSKQARLVQGFEDSPSTTSATLCPFPVDTEFFSFSDELRNLTRSRLKLSARQRFVLYSGRLSPQKGIIRLLSEFRESARDDDTSVLGIAGGFDDGMPMLGLTQVPGQFYQTVRGHLESFPADVRRRILFFGAVSQSELRSLYCAADLFTSLSLYHDEDFGMAPAEALSSGLKSVITDWGGYSSFAIPGAPCTLMPVQLNKKRGLIIDTHSLQKALAERNAPGGELGKERTRAGIEFSKVFSEAAIASRLSDILLKTNFFKFHGFNWKLKAPIVLEAKSSSELGTGLYGEVYANYASQKTIQ